MLTENALLLTFFWSGLTILVYFVAKKLHAKVGQWFTTPVLLTPCIVGAAVMLFHASYRDYISSTHWLTTFLGPVTVAFAIPIYEHRALIRRHWVVLAIGMIVGSLTAIASAWGLASLFNLDDTLRLSLLPRSISMPFAMEVSGHIGGLPDLTAIFVGITGVLGAIMGEIMLNWVPFKSVIARGALFGMGAHGAGVAKAHQMGREEGSIAGLVMVLVGLGNVVTAPLLSSVLR